MEHNEHNFDQGLKQILENPPPMPPDRAAVQAMYEQLEAGAASGLWRYFIWPRPLWYTLVLLPFLVGIGYLIFFTQKTNQRIHELELQLLQQHQTHLYDTLIHHMVVYQYDTLIRQMGGQHLQVPSLTAGFVGANRTVFQQFGQSLPGFQLIRNPSHTQMVQIGKAYSTPVRKFLLGPTGSTRASQNKTPAQAWSVESLQTPAWTLWGRLENPKNFAELREVGDLKLKKSPVPLGYRLQPLLPKEIWLGGVGIWSQYPAVGNTGLGASLDVRFAYNPQFSLNTGVAYARLRYETQEELQMARFPKGKPRNPEDRLKEVYVNQEILEIPMGFQHTLKLNGFLNPYWGLAAIMGKALSQDLGYEYISSFEEYRTDLSLGSSPFRLNSVRLDAGIQYPMGRHWIFQAGLRYTRDMEESFSLLVETDRIGAQVGLRYRLK